MRMTLLIINTQKEIYVKWLSDEIERCHLQFIRYLLNVNRRTTKIALYGETGRLPLLRPNKIIPLVTVTRAYLKIVPDPPTFYKVYKKKHILLRPPLLTASAHSYRALAGPWIAAVVTLFFLGLPSKTRCDWLKHRPVECLGQSDAGFYVAWWQRSKIHVEVSFLSKLDTFW